MLLLYCYYNILLNCCYIFNADVNTWIKYMDNFHSEIHTILALSTLDVSSFIFQCTQYNYNHSVCNGRNTLLLILTLTALKVFNAFY